MSGCVGEWSSAWVGGCGCEWVTRPHAAAVLTRVKDTSPGGLLSKFATMMRTIPVAMVTIAVTLSARWIYKRQIQHQSTLLFPRLFLLDSEFESIILSTISIHHLWPQVYFLASIPGTSILFWKLVSSTKQWILLPVLEMPMLPSLVILGWVEKFRQTDRQTDRLTDRLTDWQTDRQTDRQTCRVQVHVHTDIEIQALSTKYKQEYWITWCL